MRVFDKRINERMNDMLIELQDQEANREFVNVLQE